MRRLFILGALLTVACNEGTEAPSEPDQIAPSVKPQAVRPNLRNFKAPAMRSVDASAMILGPAPHNPRSQAGQPVQCFDGTSDGGFGGTCQRFAPTKDGAELKTNGGDPRGEYAGVFAAQGVRGKTLGQVIELRFMFAGGPNTGGAPRWSIPISEDGDATFEPPDFPVPDPTEPNEEHAFIAADRCNDGDNNVGTVDGNDDPTCLIDHKGIAYANWNEFKNAHPTWRVARIHPGGGPAFTFIVADAPTHTLIWNVASQ